MSNLDLTFVRMSCIHLEDRAGIGLRAFHFARKMGFSPRACWEIGIVVQELGSNVVRHAGGGHITLDDLRRYDAVVRDPLTVRYRDALVTTNPPPCAGGPAKARSASPRFALSRAAL